MQELFRIMPNMDPQDYKTYQIVSPTETHYREAKCQEVDCSNYREGWKTVIDEATDLGKQQAYYIRNRSGRKYRENRTAGITEFIFYSEQQCFANHQVPNGRPELYLVKEGDFRGNPRGTDPIIHSDARFWLEDFAEHQDKLKTTLERG